MFLSYNKLKFKSNCFHLVNEKFINHIYIMKNVGLNILTFMNHDYVTHGKICWEHYSWHPLREYLDIIYACNVCKIHTYKYTHLKKKLVKNILWLSSQYSYLPQFRRGGAICSTDFQTLIPLEPNFGFSPKKAVHSSLSIVWRDPGGPFFPKGPKGPKSPFIRSLLSKMLKSSKYGHWMLL